MNPNEEVSPKSINAVPTKPFSQMNAGEKAIYIGKVFVFFITAGFAFPTIFSD